MIAGIMYVAKKMKKLVDGVCKPCDADEAECGGICCEKGKICCGGLCVEKTEKNCDRNGNSCDDKRYDEKEDLCCVPGRRYIPNKDVVKQQVETESNVV